MGRHDHASGTSESSGRYQAEDGSNESAFHDVTVRIVEQETKVSSGCEDGQAWSYRSGDEAARDADGWHGTWAGESEYSSVNECRDGASTTLLGREMSATYVSGCRAGHESVYAGEFAGESGRTTGEGQGASTCRNVVVISGAGETATTGWMSRCEGPHAHESHSQGSEYVSRYSGEDHCRNGYVVEGPTGLMFFAGYRSVNEYTCESSSETQGSCEDSDATSLGAELVWAESPRDPRAIDVFVPLP